MYPHSPQLSYCPSSIQSLTIAAKNADPKKSTSLRRFTRTQHVLGWKVFGIKWFLLDWKRGHFIRMDVVSYVYRLFHSRS